jgi:hypothetical protein
MKERRGQWYLLTGLVLGLLVGLIYAWLISPVKYTNSSPASLKTGFKEQYRALIAAAYVADKNLARAQARLELLGETDIPRLLAEQAQRTLAEGGSQNDARALGLLAVALGQGPTPLASNLPLTEIASPSPTITHTISPTNLIPNPTAQPTSSPTKLVISQTVGSATELAVITNTSVFSPISTIVLTQTVTTTALPIRTPTPTPLALFVIRSRTFICDPNLSEPIIMVNTYDDHDQPVPGVEVIVSWDAGEDYFFTGLKPELGMGYADFTMIPGTSYMLRLADGGETISGLISTECQVAGENNFPGSWLVVFDQP